MGKPVKVNLEWDKKGKCWKVNFYIGKLKRVIKEKVYKNAFFFVKYQDEITLDFINDYKKNR